MTDIISLILILSILRELTKNENRSNDSHK
jgi:hypothetical protein